MKIDRAVAFVTGASSGIGAATAVELARRGATVVGVARRDQELAETVERCRRHAPTSFDVVADLSTAAGCARAVDAARERVDQLDIVVNNAGAPMRRHGLDISAADVEALLQLNFMAAVRITTAVLPAMVERGRGSVVNVTSIAGAIPTPRESAYGASKAALRHWSHVLAVDLAGAGVHIGTLSPGPIDTPIWDAGEAPSSYEGRLFPPEDVARGIARMIEREIVQLTVPRRFGAMTPMYALPGLGRAVRRGAVEFERRGARRRASREQRR